MSKASKAWKDAERRVAAMFGCLRQILSGSSGRVGNTCSDSTHPTLFIECKYRDRHATRTLWEATAALAKKERKTPVVALVDKGKPGFLLCVHSDHMGRVLAEFAGALDDDRAAKLEGMIRRAYHRIRGLEDVPDVLDLEPIDDDTETDAACKGVMANTNRKPALTEIETAVVNAAQRLVHQEIYPSVPRIWERLGKHRGPSQALIASTRKTLLERQLFPLAGGRAVSVKQAWDRKKAREARAKAQARPETR